MAKWFKQENFPGVRFRKHPTRKHGVRHDQYFTIRYKLIGKDKEEGLGWASEGWTAAKAYERLAELKQNKKAGEDPQTLAEKREIEGARREAKRAEQERFKKEAVTVSDFVGKTYFSWADENKRFNSLRSEKTLFRLWIDPIIGTVSLAHVRQIHLERQGPGAQNNGHGNAVCEAERSQATGRLRDDGVVVESGKAGQIVNLAK